MLRLDGPCEILQKIGSNAYKVDVPGEYRVSTTFNMDEVCPHYEEMKNFRA